MTSRRDFLLCGAATCFGMAAGTRLVSADDRLPDGSASKGMITAATQKAIDRGLAYLARKQKADGSFGDGHYQGNVAVTSLAALAFMSGGHQPGRVGGI